ncbi:MAG: DNA topoisomerase IV subunit A, partial [Alphaproteobacteria bacterium]|nr:DNA topoisomerase IV subunit A [Alphaproteobacteria bacterium]
FHTETTAKILVYATSGKVYTIDPSKLPGGRGFGDPVRLLVDIDEGAEIVTAWQHKAGQKLLFASSAGRGFIALSDDTIANTRKGRQVLNLDERELARFVVPVEGDYVAAIGENRKLLCFRLSEMVEMSRGKGVRIQKYKDGGMADIKAFKLSEGLTWKDTAGRTWTVGKPDIKEWIGSRADAGRLPPKGFPKSNKFSV